MPSSSSPSPRQIWLKEALAVDAGRSLRHSLETAVVHPVPEQAAPPGQSAPPHARVGRRHSRCHGRRHHSLRTHARSPSPSSVVLWKLGGHLGLQMDSVFLQFFVLSAFLCRTQTGSNQGEGALKGLMGRYFLLSVTAAVSCFWLFASEGRTPLRLF